jgi:hypothetical protein
MKTTYVFVDIDGDPISPPHLAPWVKHPVTLVAVELWPDNAPGGEDQMRMFIRYDHDKSNDEIPGFPKEGT